MSAAALAEKTEEPVEQEAITTEPIKPDKPKRQPKILKADQPAEPEEAKPKAKSEPKAKSTGPRQYEGSIAQRCDQAAAKGGTVEELAKGAGVSQSVIKSYIKARSTKGKGRWVVKQDGDKWTVTPAT